MRRWGVPVTALLLALSGCVSSSAQTPAAGTAPTVTSDSGAATDAAMARPTDPGAPADAAPPILDPAAFAANLQAATAYATEQGITVGIAVLDRVTGVEFTNGAVAGRQMWSASVVKLFLADNLLYRDRAGTIALTAEDQMSLRRMLAFSDDAAGDSLYDEYGTEDMVTEVSRRYALPAISASTDPGEWELTDISAVAVVRWYDRFLDTAPAPDRDLVVGLLQDAEPRAADGFDQTHGLANTVTGQPLAYKQGWMCCPASTSFLHSTGLVGADRRYAVAVLTERPAESGYATQALDRITQLAFPAGTFLR